MKIIVKWNDLQAEYFLLKGVKLITQMDVLCQIFKIEDSPDRFTLFIKEHNLFLSDQVINESEIQILENSKVDLMLAPIYQVDMILEYLNSEKLIKKGLMELKSNLQVNHSTFTGEFLRKGGLNILQSIIMDLSGNTLAYALNVFELVLASPECDWAQLSIKIIEKIVTLFDHNSINIGNPSLKIAIKLANNNQGYKLLIDSIKTKNESVIYAKIVNNLNSKDINTQTFTLSLINSMIASAINPTEFLEYLESYNLSLILKRQLYSTDLYFRRQIYKLQNYKLQEFVRDSTTMYNKEDESHEKLLSRLSELMFPNEPFQPVDERWKSIGFQGKDPSTDFRGMGIAGLKHLLYFAEYHIDIFQSLAIQQASLQNSANDRYYPLAVCGIHITSMLMDLVKPNSSLLNSTSNQDFNSLLLAEQQALSNSSSSSTLSSASISSNSQIQLQQQQQQQQSSSTLSSSSSTQSNAPAMNIFPVLFEQKHALEEIYCISIEIFAMVWDEGNARYMDFKRVIGFLKSQISDTLGKSSTIQEFRTNNLVMKRLVDYKKILEPTTTSKKIGTRHSKSFNNSHDDRKSYDCVRSVDSQHDLLSKSMVEQENGVESMAPYSLSDFSVMTSTSASSSPESSNHSGNTSLHISVCSLQYETAAHYLSNVNMVNICNAAGMTPLNLACMCATPQMIEMILSTPSINPSLANRAGYQPLHNLSTRKWQQDEYNRITKLFLEKNVEIDIKNPDTLETPLHLACSKSCDDNVKTLLSLGSNPNIFNKKGDTSLHISISKKNKELIQLLIQYGADMNLTNCLTGESSESMVAGDTELLGFLRGCRERYKVPDDAHMLTSSGKRPIPLPKRPSISRESTSGSPASSNRSLSPTPPTSPGVTSPSIKSATPIRHTNSVIGLAYVSSDSPVMSPSTPSNSNYLISSPSASVTPIKHQPSSSAVGSIVGTPTSGSQSQAALSSPPDLSVGSNHSSSGSSLMGLMGRGSLRLSSSSSSSSSPKDHHHHHNSKTITHKLETIKKHLGEASNVIDTLQPSDPKFKESVRRACDSVKTCKSLLTSLK